MEEHPAAAEGVLRTLQSLSEVLEQQVERAEAARDLISRMDVPGLLAYANGRSQANARLTSLQSRLSADLESIATARALPESSVAVVAAGQPALQTALLAARDRMRTKAQRLSALDSRFRASASRTQGLIRSYLGALRPIPRAYDRSGGASAAESLLTHSRRA